MEKQFLGSTHSNGVDNEALVTMFLSREAAAQLAGADKHFPGHPPTAQPTPSSQRHNGKIRLRGFAAILPLELAVVMNPQWPIRITEQGRVRF